MAPSALRPRWGIGSVRLHLDTADLAVGLLLFDRLVLPTPADDDEFQRWLERGWQPETLARRAVQLADLVERIPWDGELRERWSERRDLYATLGRESEFLGYDETPRVIAMHAWEVVHAAAVDKPLLAPVPVIWCRSPADASEQVGLADPRAAPHQVAEVERQTAVLFKTELSYPLTGRPEEALETAYSLATNAAFIEARRALHEWQLVVAAQEDDAAEALRALQEAADDYDAIVADHSAGTRQRAVHFVVPSAAGVAARVASGGAPGSAAGGRWAMKRVLAALVPLPPAPDPRGHEGAALSMARREMTTVFADDAS